MTPLRCLPLVLGSLTAPVWSGDDPLAGAPTATLLVEGYGTMTEGPLWSDAHGGLLFSRLDAPTRTCEGRTYLLVPPSTVTIVRAPSCNANGLAFDRDGALLSAEHGSRSITRGALDGPPETLASSWEGTRLNAPNDLVVRRDGSIYFTDPDFIAPTPPTLGFNGVYRIAPGDGSLALEAVVDGPNGIALSPDERTLYVADMDLGRVLAFSVKPRGKLRGERVFASGLMAPDGLTVDRDGNVFVATSPDGAGAIEVFAPNGERWGAIALPVSARNCAFGEADRRTLFITAGNAVYGVRLTVPGLRRAPAGGPRVRRPGSLSSEPVDKG